LTELLESRQLLSDNPVVTIDWNGQQAQAKAGEWILSLSPTPAIRHRPVAVQERLIRRTMQRAAATDAAVGSIDVQKYLGRPGQFLLEGSPAVTFAQLSASAGKLGAFQYVQPNFVFTAQSVPNDALFSYQWGLHNTGTTPLGPSKPDADIDAPEAWDVTTGSGDVVVAVIDSGVDSTHPDLAPNLWRNPLETAGDGVDNDRNGYVDDVYGMNAVANNGNPLDDTGHGTHIAGEIAAATNNGAGVAGVSWNSKVMSLKLLDANGVGSTADAMECLNYALSMKQRGINIKVTNNSWGASPTYNQALRDAIAATSDAGMLFVAAAGNGGADAIGDDNDTTPLYPASYDLPNVIAVAATDRNDNLGTMSNYGPTQVDLAAPGVDIASTQKGGGYEYRTGTSHAAPFVSGAAALAWSIKPGATVAQVREAIFAGVDMLPSLAGKVATGGRLNALGTLRALTNSVAGVAFDDANGNGTREAGEAVLSGRTVYLDTNNDGTPGAGEPTRTTDAGGAYRFGGLQPGTYTVRQVVPSGWTGTAPAGGAHTVQVVDGQELAGRDFGSRLVPANPPPTAAATPGDVQTGGNYYWVTVTYADDVAVDYRTIGNGDVQVTGPNGYSEPGILSNLVTSSGRWTATYRVPAPGGTWNPADNGVYTVSMRGNEVADTAGAYVPAGTLGQVNVNISDTKPPAATLSAADVTSPGDAYYFFTVRYSDDLAVDYRTIGSGDVLVTGPNGYSRPGTLANLVTSGGAWTATYYVTAPGGAWDSADNGTYTVSARANEVADTSGNFVPAGPLGTFAARFSDSTPPTAALVEAGDVAAAGAGYYFFKVTYSDNVGINYASIDGNDVLVTGPNGYSSAAYLANLTTSAGTWTATYRVPAPGGTWGAEDNGTYTVSLQPNQVADTSGNFAAAGVLGTFQSALPPPAIAATVSAFPPSAMKQPDPR
jgi:subtilisin family serine protease